MLVRFRLCRRSGLLRKKRQSRNVERPYDSEVPVVECRDFREPKPFSQRNHRRIGGAEWETRVLEHELSSPPIVVVR